MLTKGSIAEIYAEFISPEFSLQPMYKQEEQLREIKADIADDLQYTGPHVNHAIEGYQAYGRGFSFNLLAEMLPLLKNFPIANLTQEPRRLTLREWLESLSEDEVTQLKRMEQESDRTFFCRTRLENYAHASETLIAHRNTLYQMRKMDFNNYQLDVEVKDIEESLHRANPSPLQHLQAFLKSTTEHEQLAAGLSFIRANTEQLFKEFATYKAMSIEKQAQKTFEGESISRLKYLYPKLDNLMDIKGVVRKFISDLPMHATTGYKVGMDWTEFAHQLSTLYAEQRYGLLVRSLKVGVFHKYRKAVGAKALMAAHATGDMVKDVSHSLAQRLIVFTPIRVVMQLTSGVKDLSITTIRALNKHVIQRGARTVALLRDMVSAEVDTQTQKHKKWRDPSVKSSFEQVILGDLVKNPEFSQWTEDLEKNPQLQNTDPLFTEMYQAVSLKTSNTCEMVEAQGIEYLYRQITEQHIETLTEFLCLDLEEFSGAHEIQFDFEKLKEAYAQTLRTHYVDVLKTVNVLDNQQIVEDLVQGVGYRMSNQYIAQVFLTEEEAQYVQQTIQQLYKEAEMQGIYYRVKVENLYKHVGGDAYILQLKQTTPIQQNMQAVLFEKYKEHLQGVIQKLPLDEEKTMVHTNQTEDAVRELINALDTKILRVTLAHDQQITITRKASFWGVHLGTTDSQVIEQYRSREKQQLLAKLDNPQAMLIYYDLTQGKWLQLPLEAFYLPFKMEEVQQVTETPERLIKAHVYNYFAHYKAILVRQGFKLHTILDDVDKVVQHLQDVYQKNSVPLESIEPFIEEQVKILLANGVEHIMFNQYDKDIINTQTARYMTEHQITDAYAQGDISALIFHIPAERFKAAKVIYDDAATKEAYYEVICQSIEDVVSHNKRNGKDRYALATTKVQQALSQIKVYTHQEKETFLQLKGYAQKLQAYFEQQGSPNKIKLNIDEVHSLVEVRVDNQTEVFIFHPQFILNAVSHKVYADRTGLLQFADSFTSEYDALLAKDIERLASLITARRRTDYEQKALTPNDEKRMQRLYHFMQHYADEVKEYGLSFVIYKDDKIYRCQLLAQGKPVYVLNPNCILEVPTNRFVFERKNPDATLAEMEEQFLYQSHTPYLNPQQFKALYTILTTTFDLRKALPI